jgi:hypothetical protein
VLPPFGSPLLRTLPLRPTTSTPPTVKQAYVKIGFICLLDYFTFLTRSFTFLSGWLKILTKRRAGIQLHRHPLLPSVTIQQQRRGAVFLKSFVFEIVLSCQTIVLSCRTCFAFAYRELYCLIVVYVMPVYYAYFGGSPSGKAAKTGSSKE